MSYLTQMKLGLAVTVIVVTFCHLELTELMVKYQKQQMKSSTMIPKNLKSVVTSTTDEIHILKKFLTHVKTRKDLYTAYFSLPSMPSSFGSGQSVIANKSRSFECLILTSLVGSEANILSDTLSFLSNRLHYDFDQQSVNMNAMTIANELEIIQTIFKGQQWTPRSFHIQPYGFIDMSRFSVPSKFHCSQVTLVDNPLKLFKHEINQQTSMRSTLICQFCGLLVEFCSRPIGNISQDEAWILQQIARFNIEQHYSVIGLKEEFEKTFILLEKFLPRFFAGSLKFYKDVYMSPLAVPSMSKSQTISEFQEIIEGLSIKAFKNSALLHDYELYQFIVQRFHTQLLSLGLFV